MDATLSNLTIIIYACLLAVLIVLSAFFSGSETGMMASNRYRLRHLAKQNHRGARRVSKLLERTDRLLGVILIGNTFANIFAASIATIIAVHFFAELGVVIATVLLTLIILIFAEVMPKTVAAIYPEKIAFFVSPVLKLLLKIFYPIVWLVNFIANGFLRLLRINVKKRGIDPISREELRTLVHEAGSKISSKHQNMLLSILDLEKMTVDDVMIPRNEIVGIDLDDDWNDIMRLLSQSEYNNLPVYNQSIDQVRGMLHVRKALHLSSKNKLNKHSLIHAIQPAYFIPEETPLHTQLLSFQKEKRRSGLVVDEYGDIIGLVTLEDILEEIVGEFTTNVADEVKHILKLTDGSFQIDGSVNIRDLNRTTGWNFPTDGPKTLSGLIIEYLEMIPNPGTSLKIAGYPLEVTRIKGNRVKTVRVMPQLR